MTLNEFIDDHSNLLDSANIDTYTLLQEAIKNLNNDDIKQLVVALNDLGISILSHIEDDYDIVKLFTKDFTVQDFQNYLNDDFMFILDLTWYSKFNLGSIIKLLITEASRYRLRIPYTSRDYRNFENEKIDSGFINVLALPEGNRTFLKLNIVTQTGLLFECLFRCNPDIITYHSCVGFGLDREQLLNNLVNWDEELKRIITIHLTA